MEMVKAGIRNSGHLLGWTGYMQKKINENALHSQKYQKKLLHDTSNFKDNFQARFKSTKTRIELYQNESQIWTVQKGITNSAGNSVYM
jgi:hypothetical protein